MASRRAIGPWLASRRRALGITQRALARRIGRNQSVVARWESGDLELTAHDLVALGRELGFEAADALRDAEIPSERRRRSSAHWSPRQRGRMAARIRTLRVSQDRTLLAVARATGIRPYRLWKIEEGCDPSLAELAALVQELGPTFLPTVDDLLDA